MRLLRSTCSLFALLGISAGLIAQSTVISPEKFFGFQLGADRKMARWDRIVEPTTALLEKESGGRMKVINMGPTMNDNPFLMVIITSAKNMANLDTIRKNNPVAGEPARARRRPRSRRSWPPGRSSMVQSMSMHATEIGGTQMAPELAYRPAQPQG